MMARLKTIALISVALLTFGYGVYTHFKYNELNSRYIQQSRLLQKYSKSVIQYQEMLNKYDGNKVHDSNSSKFLIGITTDDLKRYLYTKYSGKISKSNIDKIMAAIEKSAIKYNIPEIVIFSILKNESDFRWWIEHERVLVKINVKNKTLKKYVRAVGMGGVIWEIWGDKLKKEGIASTRSDLFNIENNIYAVAYILSNLKNMKLLEHSKSPLDSAVLRYYGNTGTRDYANKIFSTISQIMYQKIIKG